MNRIILASASPRRRELLTQLGLKFEVVPSEADESFDNNMPTEDNVMKIAYNKACYIAPKAPEDCIIIGADTVVCVGTRILGKPKDKTEASQMLRLLSGKTHEVYTGFAILRKSDYKIEVGCEKTLVTFREIQDEEIEGYIKTGEPMDKAGAYGVQGKGAVFVKGIDGDYSNVVGLPLCSLAEALGKFDISLF